MEAKWKQGRVYGAEEASPCFLMQGAVQEDVLGVVEPMVAGAPNAVPALVMGALPVQLCVAIGRVCGYILSCLNAEYRNVAAFAFCEAVGSEVKRELAVCRSVFL